MYDVIIIGVGVIGASCARELAKYDLKVLCLEKENDVGDGASGANSAIIHSGYDPEPGTLKALLNVKGNEMFDELSSDLDVKFERIGSITLAIDDEEEKIIDSLVLRAKENKVPVEVLDHEELKRIEPNITSKVKKGLFAPTAGIINPFELVVGLMENAMDNGVELKLNSEVIGITKEKDLYVVKTNNNIYKTKVIINSAGANSDEVNELIHEKSFTIRPRKGEYFVLDHFDDNYVNHVLFNVPSSKGKGVLIAPTTHKNYLIGPSSDFIYSKSDLGTSFETLNVVKEKAFNLIDEVALGQQIRQFSGIRSVGDRDDFIIEEIEKNFINIAGIQSPGLTAAPAIALMVSDFIKDKRLKENFNPRRKPRYHFYALSKEEREKLVKQNPKFGHIICRCETVSEAEVIDAIKRNCGATTVKGVKKRVRPGFGKCQGGFCEPIIVKILAKELNLSPLEIDYGKKDSYILEEKLGEMNHD